MLIVLKEMQELQGSSITTIDWRDVDGIRKTLENRRATKALAAEVSDVVQKWNAMIEEERRLGVTFR